MAYLERKPTPPQTGGGDSRTPTSIRPGAKLPRRRGRFFHFWRRRILPVLVAVFLLGTIGAVAAVAWVSQDLPDPNKLNSRDVAESTKIYARDGSTLLYEIHGDQKRTLVELHDISPFLKNAVLSIEDKGFYKHSGISIRGILRSIYVDITQRGLYSGGSTITQQLVKNSILTREKTFTRKAKEVILSYQIERRFTKDQILKLYFNEIPWGTNAYGIEAAAQTYFGKHAKDLDLAEGALLAAMVQRPSYYSPTGNRTEELLNRQRYVLGLMVEQGYISREQADEAKTVDVLKRINPYRDRVLAPHFVFYVRDQLVEKYGAVNVERGGLRVITTLDPNLQKIAEEEVEKGVAANERRRGASNGALVATDPKTGQVLAMVGSRNYFDREHDGNFNVATAIRNPGSSFKPIVYLTAFTKGYTPDTVLFDLKTDFGPDGSGKNFVPNNYDGKNHGPLKMRQTLAGSLNIPAVKALYLAGIPQTVTLAEKLGYTTINRDRVGLALAIGGGGVRLVEHVSAFGTLGNDGVRNPISSILRIEDRNGKILEQYQKKGTRVVEQNFVRMLADVMSDNAARSFVFGSRSPLVLKDRPVAAKTGTTNDFKDGWTVGFTPNLAAGVWVGNNNNAPMRAGSDGVVVAAPIWNAFMERALKGKPVERFQKPEPPKVKKPVLLGRVQTGAGGDVVRVDSETGRRIPEACLATYPKEYIKETRVREVHTILYYVDKDNPDGPYPKNPRTDPMFERWEKPIRAWAEKNGYVASAPPDGDCSREEEAGPRISITSPKNNATAASGLLPVAVNVTSGQKVLRVEYTIDGASLATIETEPYAITLDISSLSNGFHTLRATVVDASGNRSSDTARINVLRDAPADVD